jgi:ribosomal protein S18 acetylase RimI-like enzyme
MTAIASPAPMSPRPALRPLTDADVPFLDAVYASTRREELAQVGWSEGQVDEFLAMQARAQRQDWWRNYDTGGFAVIEVDGEPVGRLFVERRSDELRIVDIALLPAWRGCGIGSTLLADVFAQADRAGLPVRIHVEFNNPAQRLYQRLGFRFVGTDAGTVYRLMERPPVRSGRAA